MTAPAQAVEAGEIERLIRSAKTRLAGIIRELSSCGPLRSQAVTAMHELKAALDCLAALRSDRPADEGDAS